MEVFGTWKTFKAHGLCVIATCIKVIEDHNQITHHMLDALYVPLRLTQAAPTVSAALPV